MLKIYTLPFEREITDDRQRDVISEKQAHPSKAEMSDSQGFKMDRSCCYFTNTHLIYKMQNSVFTRFSLRHIWSE